MLSRTSAFVLSTAVGLLLGTAQAQVPSSFRPPLAVLRSSNAGGSISDAHALQALWYAAAEMKIAADNIPRILVIHGGRDLAVAGGWPWPTKYPNSGAVLIEPTADGQKVYYLCLLGPPADDLLAGGFVQILQMDRGGPVSEVGTLTKRVLSRLGSVVRVDELQKSTFATPRE